MAWDDLPRLAAFKAGCRWPWAYEDLARAMESPYAVGVVATAPAAAGGREMAAYMVYIVSDTTGKKARKAGSLALTVGILNVVAAPAARRKGAGRFLVNAVEAGLRRRFSRDHPQGSMLLTATVPDGWLDAQLFFKAQGFTVPQEGGISRAPFDHCGDDGYIFQRRSEWPRQESAKEGGPPQAPPAAPPAAA
jgi:GNAT superfamily N-acetyltransferase